LSAMLFVHRSLPRSRWFDQKRFIDHIDKDASICSI